MTSPPNPAAGSGLDADTIVVPIDLSVLCVGDTDVNGSATQPFGTKDFARLAPDFSQLPYADGGQAHQWGPYTSGQVLADSFQSASRPLGVGIHLHWSLPQSLVHGRQDADGRIVFPPIPNRWLVTRIATDVADPTAPTTAYGAWVVESDRLWDRDGDAVALPDRNAISLDVPIRPTPTAASNRSWRTLGRVFPAAGWQEDATADRMPLTALGFGDPSYASSYGHCANVFGTWDTLDDLDAAAFPPATTRLSYVVTGWHADGVDDPIAHLAASHRGHADLLAERLAWTLVPTGAPANAAAEPPVPTRTVYSATVTDIPWDPGRHFIDPRAPGADLQVAVGNTAAEAMAALLAAQPDLAPLGNVETVIDALQAGLLDRLTLPGGLAAIEEILHQKTFAGTSQGTLWILKPAEQAAGDTMARAVRPDWPAGAGAALDALNAAQAGLDRTLRDAAGFRARIFTDWYRYVTVLYAPIGAAAGPVDPNAARAFIATEIDALKGLLTSAATMQGDVDAQAAVLRSLAGAAFTLDATDAPRFWNPTDPVVLFSGEDVRPARRVRLPAARDADGRLRCRTAADVVRAMAVDTGFTVTAADLGCPVPAVPGAIAGVAGALLAEAIFVDPWQAPVLAAGVAALGGDGNPAIVDRAGVAAAIRVAQRWLVPGDDGGADVGVDVVVTFAGTPGAPGSIAPWRAPWAPIILQWQTTCYANVMPPYPADLIVDRYRLDEGDIDLRYTGTVPGPQANARTYRGTIVLSHGTDVDLAQQIRTFLANFPQDPRVAELQSILADMDMPMQAQALSGFNQALLMLDHVLQMEVSDPLAILQGLFFSRFTNVDVKNAVGAANVDAPRGNNSFGPVRNGAFTIDRLRIVDTFGQVLDIDAPPVIRAASLVPPDGSTLIDLPIRLTQPSRLRFDWLAATGDEVLTSSDPATTPIVGWLLYNHLDEALAVYDADGTALGSFNLRGAFWQGAPGNAAVYAQPVATVFATANPHLRAVALGIAGAADPVGYLTEMLAAIDAATTFIAPGNYRQDAGLAVLIGRPIALVRAALKLEQLGPPAIDQGMAAFARAIAGGDVVDRPAGDVAGIRVPVRLGEVSDIDDGLIGYFVENGTPDDYHTLYAPTAAPDDRHGVVRPRFDQVAVTATESTAPVFVTMLVDPGASVHATTGLLPVKALTIPPAMAADALAAMAVTFLTTPIVSAGPFELPVPDENGFVWSWVTQAGDERGWRIEPVGSASQAISTAPRRAVEGWLRLAPADASASAR